MHVMITGASKGIGYRIARTFAKNEVELELSICSRNEREIWEAKRTLESEFSHINVFAAACDVSKEEEVEKFVTTGNGNFGPVDILVNNAGFGLFKEVQEMSLQEFERVIATNLRGVFLMAQAILPPMKERKSGTIVTVSSLAGRNGFRGGAAYCASKFGIRGLMQALFLDVREFNIRVITVFPGSVNTEFFDTAGHPLGDRASKVLRTDDVAGAIYSAVRLSGGATVSELDIRPTNP